MSLHSQSEKKQRAFQLMKKVIMEGKSKKQAASEMGISHDTAERSLKWAEGAKLFIEYEQRLLTDLLPLAVETAKSAMEDGDAQVAMKIMEMAEKKATRGTNGNSSDDSGGLWAEVAKLREGRVIDITPVEQTGDQLRALPTGADPGGIQWDQSHPTLEVPYRVEDVAGAVEREEGGE